jgi:hypothetical protein
VKLACPSGFRVSSPLVFLHCSVKVYIHQYIISITRIDSRFMSIAKEEGLTQLLVQYVSVGETTQAVAGSVASPTCVIPSALPLLGIAFAPVMLLRHWSCHNRYGYSTNTVPKINQARSSRSTGGRHKNRNRRNAPKSSISVYCTVCLSV